MWSYTTFCHSGDDIRAHWSRGNSKTEISLIGPWMNKLSHSFQVCRCFYKIDHIRFRGHWSMENLKRVHNSIKPPVWSPASAPNLSKSSLARRAAVSGFANAQPSTDRARCAHPHSPPAKLGSDRFGKSAWTKPAGLIESWILWWDIII